MEESEGSSYLAALKRSSREPASGTSTASAPTRSMDRSLPASVAAGDEPRTAQLARSEKRRSARYKCNGSAEIRKDGIDARTWATCTDISLNGCYLETTATYPPGTVLHLRIETNKFRIQAEGNVRVTYPQTGMGIAFAYMADEERSRLKDMLRTLAPPSVMLGVSSTARDISDPMPSIADANAALSELIAFFEKRQMLTRSEFLLLLRRSQNPTNGSLP